MQTFYVGRPERGTLLLPREHGHSKAFEVSLIPGNPVRTVRTPNIAPGRQKFIPPRNVIHSVRNALIGSSASRATIQMLKKCISTDELSKATVNGDSPLI